MVLGVLAFGAALGGLQWHARPRITYYEGWRGVTSNGNAVAMTSNGNMATFTTNGNASP